MAMPDTVQDINNNKKKSKDSRFYIDGLMHQGLTPIVPNKYRFYTYKTCTMLKCNYEDGRWPPLWPLTYEDE